METPVTTPSRRAIEAPNTLTHQIIRSIEDIERFREVWQTMQWHPNADIDFYLTIIGSRPQVLRPHIVVIEKEGAPTAMIIGRLEETRFKFKVGYRSLWSTTRKSITVVYGGLLGDQSEMTVKYAVEVLLESLRNGEAEVLTLSNLRLDSEFYRVAKTRPSYLCRDFVSTPKDHFNLNLGDSYEDVFQRMSSKHRSELRRLPRVLEKHYPETVKICCYKSPEDVSQLCKDADAVMKNTYQRGLGAGFVANEENIRRMRLSADRHWLVAYFLYVGSTPCAFWIGALYGETLFLEFTGYDPAFKKYQPGTILLKHMITDMESNYCHIKRIDYGFGDALYKQRFANEGWYESTVQISAPTLKGIAMNASRNINAKLNKSAAGFLERLGLIQRFKTIWRKRLASKN